MKLKNIKEFFVNPVARFDILSSRGLLDWMDDETYLRKYYKLRMGKELNLENPQTFNEKLQWLKLHDRKDIYTTMVDKYEVKKYVSNIIGEQYIIPTYGVWDRFDDIDFDSLPEQFVLKCTHDSGGLIIVRDKSKLDIKAAKKKINKCLKRNYYSHGREWPYKNVKPRIIAEKYMEDKGRIVPEDYKIYCLNGKPKYIVVFHNRFDPTKEKSETVYDTEWKPQGISLDEHFKISDEITERPKCLNELLTISTAMCKNHSEVRCDFYVIENRIYFGEITLHTASGFQPMIPREIDDILGKELVLSINDVWGGI